MNRLFYAIAAVCLFAIPWFTIFPNGKQIPAWIAVTIVIADVIVARICTHLATRPANVVGATDRGVQDEL
jgi:hypothetical protein